MLYELYACFGELTIRPAPCPLLPLAEHCLYACLSGLVALRAELEDDLDAIRSAGVVRGNALIEVLCPATPSHSTALSAYL